MKRFLNLSLILLWSLAFLFPLNAFSSEENGKISAVQTLAVFNTSSASPENTRHYTTDFFTMQEQNAWNLLNQDRSRYGLSVLPLDSALSAIAREKSRDMYANGYFGHTSPAYGSARDMLKFFGYSFKSVGENIAHHATVEKSQAAFLSSPMHRVNMLAKHWTKVGIGVWADKNGFVYVTQLFAR